MTLINWKEKPHFKKVNNEKIKVFLDDIEAVCRKHGLSISHEDYQGGFVIEKFSLKNMTWLKNASDGMEV